MGQRGPRAVSARGRTVRPAGRVAATSRSTRPRCVGGSHIDSDRGPVQMPMPRSRSACAGNSGRTRGPVPPRRRRSRRAARRASCPARSRRTCRSSRPRRSARSIPRGRARRRPGRDARGRPARPLASRTQGSDIVATSTTASNRRPRSTPITPGTERSTRACSGPAAAGRSGHGPHRSRRGRGPARPPRPPATGTPFRPAPVPVRVDGHGGHVENATRFAVG